MKAEDHYSDHFRALFNTYGHLSERELQQLIANQLTALRQQLVEQKYTPREIERETKAAQVSAANVFGTSTVYSEAAQPEKMEPPARRARQFPKLWHILLATFVVIYVAVLAMFLGEGHPKLTVTGIGSEVFAMEAEFIAVDPVRETITLSLIPDLSAEGVSQRGRLTRDISVEIDTGVQLLTHTYKKGEPPIAWLATIPIEEGDQLEYPLDKYTGDFRIRIIREGGDGIAPNLELDKVQHGFRLQATAAPTDDGSQLDVDYIVRRSPAVLLLAGLAMFSLLLVVMSAINVAWHVTVRGRKPEFSMMTWIAALLFVVPAVRNGLPGGPPPGALIDVALFFWLHVLTAGSLLFVVSSWSRQKS